MFIKNSTDIIYTPFGKSKEKVYKPPLYDDEKVSPFEEIAYPKVKTNLHGEELVPEGCSLTNISKDYPTS